MKKILGKVEIDVLYIPLFIVITVIIIEDGENFFANYNCILLDINKIIIGNNAMLASGVIITTADHPIHSEARNSGWEYGKSIKIGNNVWLGAIVIINPCVTIGDIAVVGPSSVVVHDIPENVVCVGNPARIIKRITGDDKLFYYKKRNSM